MSTIDLQDINTKIDQAVNKLESDRLLKKARRKVEELAKRKANPRLIKEFDRYVSSQIVRTF